MSIDDRVVGVAVPAERGRSLDRQLGHARRQDLIRYPSAWASNHSQHGSETTRARTPRSASSAAASTQTWTSLPVPTRTTSGGSRLVDEHVPARAKPSGARSAVSARTGIFCRDRISVAGSSLFTAIRQAWEVSLASAGRITWRPGIARIAASCSIG